MVNKHLSADEIVRFEQLVQEIAACWQPAKVGHFRKGEIREIW